MGPGVKVGIAERTTDAEFAVLQDRFQNFPMNRFDP